MVLADHIGSKDWKNYTIDVDFQINEGEEGCLVFFAFQDDGNYVMYNVGGWANCSNAFEPTRGNVIQYLQGVAAHYENGQWYHVRIVVHGAYADAYVDGLLMSSLVWA